MAKHKNRFNESELKGIFDCMLGKEAIDLGDVVIKHFRKFGDEYELKMIIPK